MHLHTHTCAQAARIILRAEDSLLQLRKDWNSLDLHSIFAHTLYAVRPLDVSQQYIEMVPGCMWTSVYYNWQSCVEIKRLFHRILCLKCPYRLKDEAHTHFDDAWMSVTSIKRVWAPFLTAVRWHGTLNTACHWNMQQNINIWFLHVFVSQEW